MTINASRSSPEHRVGAGGLLNKSYALLKIATRVARASRQWQAAGVQLPTCCIVGADCLQREGLLP